ncbi:hypothetical protein QBC37DRAFT_378768 [Rhypophila decipiens]|uniref:Uncharacterized protein n=1 Tax=Rhypophila decipiens TaxID=261697 RepID=A0AAN6XXK3_9PEZI|nr:hypothetical protein QBC37DRAFT_378768 [Rhypophila decipiens]
MGRKTANDIIHQAQRELDAGQRAYEARNAQIDEWSAREKERIEQKYAAKRAALAAARQEPGPGGPAQSQVPGQVMSNVAPAQFLAPTQQVAPLSDIVQPVYTIPGQVQQVQVQGPLPIQSNPRPKRSPHEVMQGIKLSAISQRRVDDISRREQINQANKAGGPVPVFAPLPAVEEYVAAWTRRAVERGEITWKEVKKVDGHDDGCCILM